MSCPADDANAIVCGLDSLGLVSLTSEALLSAMTWLAVHKMRSQIIWADSDVWWNEAFWLRVKEKCPKKLWIIPVQLSSRCPSPSPSASRPSHTDCTCLILAHHSLTRLRCPAISWLDHRRLQASKTSDTHGQPKETRLSHHIRTIKVLFWNIPCF